MNKHILQRRLLFWLRRGPPAPGRCAQLGVGRLWAGLAGKVSEPTLELLGTLVTGRWPSGAELLNNVERLLVEALLVSAERAGELAEVEDELFRFGQVVDGDRDLARAIADSTVPAQRRAELVKLLLAGKVRQATLALAELAVHGYGGRAFFAGLNRLVELAAARREREVAYVTVAAPISEQAEQRLGATLAQLYGREVSMKVTIDPEILGGMSVRVGSDLYDGTVVRRLADTRNALTTR